MVNRSARVWSAVHDQRQTLFHDLEALTPSDWQVPSLCPGWDVHDVLAHLIDSAKTTRWGFVRRMVSAGFDFDRDNAVGVTRERATDPKDTLTRFRAVIMSTTTPPAALATRLVEVFVHGEDIRGPLGIAGDYPAEPVAEALRYQVKTSIKMGGGKESAQRWRLVASDTPFKHGQGPEVRGPAIALLLGVSGRPVESAELTGPGAHAFLTMKTTSEKS